MSLCTDRASPFSWTMMSCVPMGKPSTLTSKCHSRANAGIAESAPASSTTAVRMRCQGRARSEMTTGWKSWRCMRVGSDASARDSRPLSDILTRPDATGLPQENRMRIPFWTPAQAQRDPALVAAIEPRRGGRLLNLDRMLLWSEPLARSWNVFLRTLRQELSLAPRLRELAICVVARATGADYEFHHHAPEFEKAGGSAAKVAALDNPDAAANSALFDALEQNVIRYALASTRAVKVPDALFATLSRQLSPAELIELTAVVAGYNMVARFLVALQVPPES